MRSSVLGTFRRLRRLVLVLPLAWFASGLAAREPVFTGPVESGKLAAPPKNEASGMAASRGTDGLLWLHDDSGGAPVLYAVDARGASRGALRVAGVRNRDWEDVASFQLDGKSWLLIGDIGDNDAERGHVFLYLLEEPAADRLAPGRELTVRPTATWRLAYADGPRDAESLAVDPAERAIYLLTKRDAPPRLYRVPFPNTFADDSLTARHIGVVSQLPQPSSWQSLFKNHLGAFRGWPCAMDFSPDGSFAVVLTYGDVLLFPRRPGESWAQTLANEPVVLGAHGLPQAEAVCFSGDGAAIFVASESSRKLLRYDLARAPR